MNKRALSPEDVSFGGRNPENLGKILDFFFYT